MKFGMRKLTKFCGIPRNSAVKITRNFGKFRMFKKTRIPPEVKKHFRGHRNAEAVKMLIFIAKTSSQYITPLESAKCSCKNPQTNEKTKVCLKRPKLDTFVIA